MATGKIHSLDPTLYPIEAPEDNFYQENQFIERFYELLTNSIEPPMAISIDGAGGTGKTTVMRLLQKRLSEEYCTFWFSPWRHRTSESIALSFLQNFAITHYDDTSKLVRSGEKLFKVLLSEGISTALKALRVGDRTLLASEIDKEIQPKKIYEQYIDSFDLIRNEWRKLLEAIAYKYERKTTFIFFDDLERCLPEEVITVFESIKNLFLNSGTPVVFICGIDSQVAHKFISQHFREVEESFISNYFRKIFDLTISIPYQKNIYTLLLEYAKHIFSEIANDNEVKQIVTMIYTRGIQAEIESVRSYFNILHNVAIFLQFNPEYTINPELDPVLPLLVIKEAWPSLYKSLIFNAMKNRLASLVELVEIIQNDSVLSPSQTAFVSHYLLETSSSIGRIRLMDLLLKYPTLA